jgi:hypothetical protein
MTIKPIHIIQALIVVWIAFSICIANYFPDIRKILYGILPFSLFMYLIVSKNLLLLKSPPVVVSFFIIWAALIGTSLVFNFQDYKWLFFVKETILIIYPLITAILLYSIFSIDADIKKVVTRLYIVICILYLGLFFSTGSAFNFSHLLNILQPSKVDTENVSAFMFGAFSGYFYLNRKYLYFFSTIPLTIMASKRIVFLSIFALIVSDFLFKRTLRNPSVLKKNLMALLLTGINVLFLVLLKNLATHEYDDLIQSTLGVSPNLLFTGRITVFQSVFEYFGNLPIIGDGVGFATYLLQSETVSSQLGLLHSDVVKFFLEFGLIPFTIGLFFLYRTTLAYPHAFCLLVYYNVLGLTDNITIYVDTMLIVYILMSASVKVFEKGKNEVELA